jgi:hypothetical protein
MWRTDSVVDPFPGSGRILDELPPEIAKKNAVAPLSF